MKNETVKRILHAKNSITKAAFFRDEIINCLENGIKVTVVNMPEFEAIGDARIACRSADDICAIFRENKDEHSEKCRDILDGQALFVFEIYPNTAFIETLGKHIEDLVSMPKVLCVGLLGSFVRRDTL